MAGRRRTGIVCGEMKSILVATDGSAASDTAVEEAIELASRFHERLVVAVVVKPAFPSRARVNGSADPVPSATACARADLIGVAALARATEAYVDGSAVVTAGIPAFEICRLAEEHDARIVVVGCHRRGTAGRAVFGSVSRAVLNHCARPVLVVPPRVAARSDERPFATAAV
jgi:nucleotide-binding universal stress UspA family protein